MRVALLNTKNTRRGRYLLTQLACGLARFGDTSFWVNEEDNLALLDKADLAAQICWPNIHHNFRADALFRLAAQAKLKEQNKRLLTIDSGFLRSQVDIELGRTPSLPEGPPFHVDDEACYPSYASRIYYSVGYDGIKRNGDYCLPNPTPSDRWDSLRRNLDLRLCTWRNKGEHIVLIGQTQYGPSSQGMDVTDWMYEAVAKIRKVSRRPILVRPHPRLSYLRVNHKRQHIHNAFLHKLITNFSSISVSTRRNIDRDLADAHLAVVYTSNAGAECVLAGIPTVCCNPAGIAWEVADHALNRVEKPRLYNRGTWLRRLCYSQWNAAELADGSVWKQLRPGALLAGKHS